MAETRAMTSARSAVGVVRATIWWRAGAVASVLALWQVLAMSGLFFQDVVPRLSAIGRALAALAGDAEFAGNLPITLYELALATGIGAAAGVAVGLALGGNRLLTQAYELYLHYLAPTPKIIFFPVMIMWFGVGPGSKIAMGAISCFFPVALSVAASLRGIDPVLMRVGRSFGASRRQMITKICLPAIRASLLNGLRLGFGVAVIGVLLAETKLSNRGIGFLIIESYARFDMPRMYALLIAVFAVAALVNALAGRFGGGSKQAQAGRN